MTGEAAALPTADLAAVRVALSGRANESVAVSVILSESGAYSRAFDLPHQLDEVVEWVGCQATPGRTVSVGVASLSVAGAARLKQANISHRRARPRHGEHSGYAWVAADLDPGEAETEEALRCRLLQFPYPATLLVSSGHGLHAWWKLDQPVDVGRGQALLHDLARALAGDRGAADEGRALRLAGTFTKPGVGPLATVLNMDVGRTYAADLLGSAACDLSPRPAPPAAPTRRTRSTLDLPGGSTQTDALRSEHDLAETLTDLCGAPRAGKWRCPGDHDETASLNLHPKNPERWFCHGGKHPDSLGRSTRAGFSGDVTDLLAWGAGQSVEQFLKRRRPARSSVRAPGAAHPVPVSRTGPQSKDEANVADRVRLLALELFELGCDTTDEPFAVSRLGPRVIRPLRGGGRSLRSELSYQYAQRYDRVPSSSALADAMSALEGQAGQQEKSTVGLRVATHRSGELEQILIDLGDTSGQVVSINEDGWRLIQRSPMLFRRTKLTSPLPVPERGGDLTELRDLLNVTDQTWPLLIGWITAALMPDIPHPIAFLTGEQGAGKSTAADKIVRLLDPSPANLRMRPKDEEAWATSAAGSYVVGIDNISTIPPWWSDALCRAVTGDALVRRQLYTDSELTVLQMRRVVLLTSIDAGALRGDLADRLLTIDLEPIAEEARTTDRALAARWAVMHPRVLGAILDLLSQVLGKLPEARAMLTGRPRMADFAEVLCAVDLVRRTDSLGQYLAQAERLAQDVADADPVAHAIVELMGHRDSFAGTAALLLEMMVPPEPRPRGWPSDATRLSHHLGRIAPALRASGIRMDRTRSGQARMIRLIREPAI